MKDRTSQKLTPKLTLHSTSMNAQDICASIHGFPELLETGGSDEQSNIRTLELALDRLGLAYHFASEVFEDGHSDPPSQDYGRWRRLAVLRFPKFGFYNVPSHISHQVLQAEMLVGDALDDVADIAHDLSEVIWCWTHTSENDALWLFRWGYDQHWGEHLRDLQRYLYDLHRVP
jgi:hypothetical protein